MTLEQWRNDQAMVEWARNMQAAPEFQVLVDVLTAEHPKNNLTVRPADGVGAALELGEIRGYDEAINKLLLAAKPPDAGSERIEATFEPPENEDA